MPYYIYCKRCNEDGSFLHVKEDCPKCDGSGKDWRNDYELSNYHKWAGFSIEELKRNHTLTSKDGTKFVYSSEFTTLEEDIIYVKNMKLIHYYKNIPQLKNSYEYYIEPCQLCISRGVHDENCGWCEEEDTFGGKSDKYIGNLTKIPHGGWGYPFHELPHPERKYYTKNGKYLKNKNGFLPSEINEENIKEAIWRNTYANKLFSLIKDGTVFKQRSLSIDNEQVQQFLNTVDHLNEFFLQSPGISDVTGKVEFRFLNYNIFGLNQEDINKLLNIKFLIDRNLKSELQERINNDIRTKYILEVIFHEAFHIYQALVHKSLAIKFEAERRLNILKWMLSKDYFLSRNKTVSFGTNFYSLLNRLDETSELYPIISRQFDYARGDIELVSKYTQSHSMCNLTLFDLIEGSAYIFQKYFVSHKNIELFEEENLPSIYKNAWKYYSEHEGKNYIEFLLFVHQSLKIGLILEENDIANSPYSPLSLFYYLCDLKQNYPDFLKIDLPAVNSIDDISHIFTSLGYSLEHISGLIEGKHVEDIKSFLEITLHLKKIETELFTFLKHINISETDYKNLKYLSEKLDDVRNGQADERISAVKQVLIQKYPYFEEDIFFPLMLTFKYDFYNMFLTMDKNVNGAVYKGGFGDNNISTKDENEALDFINRIENCITRRKAFCCEKHGEQKLAKIVLCQNKNGLNKKTIENFGKTILDLVK